MNDMTEVIKLLEKQNKLLFEIANTLAVTADSFEILTDYLMNNLDPEDLQEQNEKVSCSTTQPARPNTASRPPAE